MTPTGRTPAMAEPRRPRQSDLRPGDFIAWQSDSVQVLRVQVVHSNGFILRDAYGHVDQFDSLPQHWRPATVAEIATYRGEAL